MEENGGGLDLGARLIRGGEVDLLRVFSPSPPGRRCSGTSNVTPFGILPSPKSPHASPGAARQSWRAASSGAAVDGRRSSGAETLEVAAWEVAGLRKGWRACARRGAATCVSGILGEGRGPAAKRVGEPKSKHPAAGSGLGRKLQWIDLCVSARRNARGRPSTLRGLGSNDAWRNRRMNGARLCGGVVAASCSFSTVDASGQGTARSLPQACSARNHEGTGSATPWNMR